MENKYQNIVVGKGSGRTYEDIVEERNRSRKERLYRKPDKKPGRLYQFARAGALVGALTLSAVYCGAVYHRELKAGAAKIAGFFSKSEPAVSIDTKITDEDKQEVMEFVKNMNDSGMDFDKIRPHLKPESARKMEALRAIYGKVNGGTRK